MGVSATPAARPQLPARPQPAPSPRRPFAQPRQGESDVASADVAAIARAPTDVPRNRDQALNSFEMLKAKNRRDEVSLAVGVWGRFGARPHEHQAWRCRRMLAAVAGARPQLPVSCAGTQRGPGGSRRLACAAAAGGGQGRGGGGRAKKVPLTPGPLAGSGGSACVFRTHLTRPHLSPAQLGAHRLRRRRWLPGALCVFSQQLFCFCGALALVRRRGRTTWCRMGFARGVGVAVALRNGACSFRAVPRRHELARYHSAGSQLTHVLQQGRASRLAGEAEG